MASKSKSGSMSGGKTKSSSGSGAKSDVITVRVSPKLKHGLELLSRKQHRSLSSVVTWAVEQLVNDRDIGLFDPRNGTTLGKLWHVHPADRLVKLASYWPELMTYEEELLVEQIKDEGWGWPVKKGKATQELRDNWAYIHFDHDLGKYYFGFDTGPALEDIWPNK